MNAVAPYVGGTGEPYITTLPPPRPGYLVRIPTEDGSGRFQHRTFRGQPEDMEQNFASAVAWRNFTYLALYGQPAPDRRFHAHQANSTTQVVGVRLIVKKVRSRHGTGAVYEIPVYLAEVWLQPGRDGNRPRRSRSCQYAIAKYGAEEAFRKATAWRMLAQEALERGEPLPQRL